MTTATPARSRDRAQLDDSFKWKLEDIYPDWAAWDAARAELDRRINEYAALKGTLGTGPDRLVAAFRLNDDLGQRAYKVHFYASLKFDEDQRDNSVNGHRQQVQALMALWQQ